jgi:outer membrane murein-binding lipoprotein Lpp
MTVEERFERIEHVTAGLAEQFRNEREENRLLWRETRVLWRETKERIDQLARESREADKRLEARIDQLGEKIEQLAAESRAADQRLSDRIDAMVSGIGQFISKQNLQS